MGDPSVGLEECLLKAECVAQREIKGEVLLFNTETGLSYSLRGIGGRIWNMLDGSTSVEDIVKCVCQEYEVQTETAKTHTLVFLGKLLREELATRVGGPRPRRAAAPLRGCDMCGGPKKLGISEEWR